MRVEFKASYMGTVWYRVTSRDYIAEVECRLSLGEYERSIANGADVVRDMENRLGLCSIGLDAPPPAVVDAINAYRLDNWTAAKARLGDDVTDPAPAPIRAGRWTRETSWQPVEPAA